MIDVTGIELASGNSGQDCPGNGKYLNKDGDRIECCCDECDYMMCCLENHDTDECIYCEDNECPNSSKK